MKQDNWYHGTPSDKFKEWIIPSPVCKDHLTTHSGVFFTSNKAAAKSYGPNICKTTIKTTSSIFDLTSNEIQFENLRLELLKTEMGSNCIYTENSSKWKMAWEQSCVFGHYLSSCPVLNRNLYVNETSIAFSIKKQREWVENICSMLKEMGYSGLFTTDWIYFGGKKILRPYKVFVALSLDIIEPPKWQ